MDFDIIERYSSNEDLDKFNRWARVVVYNGISIAWINKLKNTFANPKYTSEYLYSVSERFPMNSNDIPYNGFVTESYEEALTKIEEDFTLFKTKLN